MAAAAVHAVRADAERRMERAASSFTTVIAYQPPNEPPHRRVIVLPHVTLRRLCLRPSLRSRHIMAMLLRQWKVDAAYSSRQLAYFTRAQLRLHAYYCFDTWRLRAARLLSLLDSGKHVHEPDVLVFKVRRVRLYPAAGTHVQLSGQEWSGGVAGGIEVSVKAQACRVVQPATAAAVEHRATGAVSAAKKVTTAAEWRAETAEVRATLLRALAARR